MTDVYINRIATAVPGYDVHKKFVDYAATQLKDERTRKLFMRMAGRAQIDHRYSVFDPDQEHENLDGNQFYRSQRFPNTAQRMQIYQEKAFDLVKKACDQLNLSALQKNITHVIVTSCTGFYAPGLDFQIVQHYGLSPHVERSFIGFMGCSAAINALKMAYHIVRSSPAASVLVVNLELCTLHLQETDDLEKLLSFTIFADGAAASLISAKPEGLMIESFYSTILTESDQQLTWQIGQDGFDMVLSGQVPLTVIAQLPSHFPDILHGASPEQIDLWAVHPGGRSILDAVEEVAALPPAALTHSRNILRNFGNMSSATVMFVLKEMMHARAKGNGCAMAFGPGITAETMLFQNK